MDEVTYATIDKVFTEACHQGGPFEAADATITVIEKVFDKSCVEAHRMFYNWLDEEHARRNAC